MAKIIKLRVPVREFMVAVGAYLGGVLLKICSARVGAFSRGGGNSMIYSIGNGNPFLLDQFLNISL